MANGPDALLLERDDFLKRCVQLGFLQQQDIDSVLGNPLAPVDHILGRLSAAKDIIEANLDKLKTQYQETFQV